MEIADQAVDNDAERALRELVATRFEARKLVSRVLGAEMPERGGISIERAGNERFHIIPCLRFVHQVSFSCRGRLSYDLMSIERAG